MADLFSTDDFREHAEEIFERVRSGREIRLFDPAGFDFTLLPTTRAESWRTVANVCATLLSLLQARGAAPGGEPFALVDYGEWTWLRHLDGEALDDFLEELIAETVIACREQTSAGLTGTLDRWRQEADAARASQTDPPPRKRRRR